MNGELKAPFPWFGGKKTIASLIWKHLGCVDNYIEPFAGSCAVLLLRPDNPQTETINDADHFVANFWRATQHEPEAVAHYADNPVSEIDLHSRHRWLLYSNHAAQWRQKMLDDPDHFDAKVAGWWCWGLCCWIGSGWCREEWFQTPLLSAANGQGVDYTVQQIPHISDVSGRGVYATPPQGRPQLADAFDIGRGVNAQRTLSTCKERQAWLVDWFRRLRDRLRLVRVCYGDWQRICDSPSTTTRLGLTGIFFDPPYAITTTKGKKNRTKKIYATDGDHVDDLVKRVRDYCLERGSDPRMRIALCGYEGEGHELLEENGWRVEWWKANGGYANAGDAEGKENARRERIWFSPHCQLERGLFD